jgi:hypothetical protein
MKAQWRSRRGYALAWVAALIFLVLVLVGVEIAHMGYAFEVLAVHSKRVQARSELVSMTHLALRWLRAELETGTRPRAEAIELDKSLTDFNLLSIFSSDVSEIIEGIEGGGEVQVFDLEYDPENVVEPVGDPLAFLPCFPGGYLVRAKVAKKGLAPITVENVYVVTSFSVPGKGIVHALKERPLYWREVFR